MSATSDVFVVYDGECPLCQFGVRRVIIPENIGNLVLLDARQETNHPVLLEIKRLRIDLDDGVVAVIGGNYFQGSDAIYALSRISATGGRMRKIYINLFRSRLFCTLAYPFLKSGRRLALWIKSVPLIRNLQQEEHI